MNKQELVEKYKSLLIKAAPFPVVGIDTILEDLKQLDEPQKVEVPQFVASWIEKCKTFKYFAVSLSFALQPSAWEVNRLSDECIEWLTDAENQDLFARAWLDGYEIKKEKRYLVSMPNTSNHKGHNQILCEKDNKFFWCGEWHPFKTKFTYRDLEEAGFEWVCSCPGIEVVEVTE